MGWAAKPCTSGCVRYAAEGLGGLADRSNRPDTCPHQMPPAVEARVLKMRRFHPSWGPRTILNRLIGEDLEPLPGLSSIYRALVRHHLIEPNKRRRRPSEYKRWERSRPMELWQMDITAGAAGATGSWRWRFALANAPACRRARCAPRSPDRRGSSA